MWDFLTFDRFITQHVLLIAYYLGAVGMPLALWMGRRYLLRKIALLAQLDLQRQALFGSLSPRHQTLIVVLLILMFLFMELVWRMMFEAMIGYFQMHDYLQIISSRGASR